MKTILLMSLLLLALLLVPLSSQRYDTNQTIAHYDITRQTITITNEVVSDILDFGEISCEKYDKNFVFVYIDFGEKKYYELYDQIQYVALGADAAFNYSAQLNGGIPKHINFETDASCNVALRYISVAEFLQYGINSKTIHDTLMQDQTGLNSLVHNSFGGNVRPIFISNFDFCGYSTIYLDDSKENNKNEDLQNSIFIGEECLFFNIVAHEIVHSLGGVQPKAPYAFIGFHCFDQFDIMCGNLQLLPYPKCANRNNYYILVDCNGDTYYNTNVITGYLKTHRNIADSGYLH